MKTIISIFAVILGICSFAQAQESDPLDAGPHMRVVCAPSEDHLVLQSVYEQRTLPLKLYSQTELQSCLQAAIEFNSAGYYVCATDASGTTLMNTLSSFELIKFESRSNCLNSIQNINEGSGLICATQDGVTDLVKLYPKPERLFTYGGATQAADCRKAQGQL